MWAIIDIGSNTIRLVIYVIEQGQPRPMLNKKYAVGLAGYVDQTNRIQDEGVQVLLEALTEIKTILDHIRPQCVFPFGTAALRNSANGAEIVSLIRQRCGLDIRILTGEEEAVFDYYGAQQDGIGRSGLLVDVGGGSTELTYFKDRKVLYGLSIPLGSLNLYKSQVEGLIPTLKEARRIKKVVGGALCQLPLSADQLAGQPIYSVGGTARTALKLMQKRYGLGGSNAYTRAQLKQFLLELENDPRDLTQYILRTAPERIHTLIPGLLVFQTVSKQYQSGSFITSRYGVREGYLVHCLEQKGVLS